MKKIKIIDTPWHVAHNYSLCSIPNTEWGLLVNNVRKWNWDARPMPKNTHWVPYYEKGKYDIAFLHIDQQCVDPMIGKGQLFRELNQAITDIPKIIINHGTPYWPERWSNAGSNSWTMPTALETLGNKKKIKEYQRDFLINGGKTTQGGKTIEIEGIKKLVGNNLMIVNSRKAQDQWGWGHLIWHGLDLDEWKTDVKEPRAIITLSPAGLDAYYGRNLLTKTQELLKNKYGYSLMQVGDAHSWSIALHPKLAEIGGFSAYRDYVARSLVYVNITQESPMPRGRTEAMLSGCCTLTTPFHDADKFINFDTRIIWRNSESIDEYIANIDKIIDTDGINGMLIPNNPQAIAALTYYLITEKYETAIKIGLEGQKTAQKLFNKKRYDQEYLDIFKKILNKEEIENRTN